MTPKQREASGRSVFLDRWPADVQTWDQKYCFLAGTIICLQLPFFSMLIFRWTSYFWWLIFFFSAPVEVGSLIRIRRCRKVSYLSTSYIGCSSPSDRPWRSPTALGGGWGWWVLKYMEIFRVLKKGNGFFLELSPRRREFLELWFIYSWKFPQCIEKGWQLGVPGFCRFRCSVFFVK